MSDPKHALPVSGSKLLFFFASLASLIRCCFKKDCRMFCIVVGTAPYNFLNQLSKEAGMSFEDTTAMLLMNSLADLMAKEVSSDD